MSPSSFSMHFYYFAWKSTFFLCYYPLIMNVEFRRFLVVNVVWMLLVLHTHQSFIDAHKSFRPFLRPLFGRQHPPTLFFATENSKRNSSKNNPESIWTTLPHYSKKIGTKTFFIFLMWLPSSVWKINKPNKKLSYHNFYILWTKCNCTNYTNVW